jgi:hypothetical protein
MQTGVGSVKWRGYRRELVGGIWKNTRQLWNRGPICRISGIERISRAVRAEIAAQSQSSSGIRGASSVDGLEGRRRAVAVHTRRVLDLFADYNLALWPAVAMLWVASVLSADYALLVTGLALMLFEGHKSELLPSGAADAGWLARR